MTEHIVERAPAGEQSGTVSLELVEVEGRGRDHAHRGRVSRAISQKGRGHVSAMPAVPVHMRVVRAELVVYGPDAVFKVTVVAVEPGVGDG